MQFVRFIVFFLIVALVASACNIKGLEFLATDAAKWTLIVGIVVCAARLIGVGKSSL